MEKFLLTVHETDERMYYLKRMLKDTKVSRPTHAFAPNIVIDARALEDIEDGAYVFCGRVDKEGEALANSRNITLDVYSKDEKFQAINSRLTAEGALKILLERSTKGLFDIKALVIGFGRTGSAVARILSDVGVKLDVASVSSVRQAYAVAERVIPPANFDFVRFNFREPIHEERFMEICEYENVIIEFDDNDSSVFVFGEESNIQKALKEMAPFFTEQRSKA